MASTRAGWADVPPAVITGPSGRSEGSDQVTLAQDQVHGATVSEAWLNAVQVVDAAPQRRLFHLVTRISDPVTEEPRIRAAADTLLRDLDLAPVDTVANTIFPARLAAASAGPGELAQRYRRIYPTLRRLHKSNRKGTYFGRIVAHPAAGGERDQLADLIERLNTELRTPGPKSARYEMNISGPGELAQPAEECPAEESRTAARFTSTRRARTRPRWDSRACPSAHSSWTAARCT